MGSGGACVSPASSPHAIGVGGWDVEAKRPAGGPRVGLIGGVLKPDLLAPAVPLVVPSLDGRHREKAGGTSFAAALVARAALALVRRTPGSTARASSPGWPTQPGGSPASPRPSTSGGLPGWDSRPAGGLDIFTG